MAGLPEHAMMKRPAWLKLGRLWLKPLSLKQGEGKCQVVNGQEVRQLKAHYVGFFPSIEYFHFH